MRYTVITAGESRSFVVGDAFLDGSGEPGEADILVVCDGAPFLPAPKKLAIVIELGAECLSAHIDPDDSHNANVLGFARFRNGSDQPSNLIELVRHTSSSDRSVGAATGLFASAGFEVVLCCDQPGRIINRLAIPKYNAALRFLDEGLASQADMDLTCRLGLGYPDGPVERVKRGGLAAHFEISKSLHEAFGTTAFSPAPLAASAFARCGSQPPRSDVLEENCKS